MSSDSEDSSVSLNVKRQSRKTTRKTDKEDSFESKKRKKSARSGSKSSSENLNVKPKRRAKAQSKSRMPKKPDSKIKSKTSRGSRNLREPVKSYRESSPEAVDTSGSESSSDELPLKRERKSSKISDNEASDENLKSKKNKVRSSKTYDNDHYCFQCSAKFSSSKEEYYHTCKGKPEKGFLCKCKKLLSSFRGMETHKRFGCNRQIPKVIYAEKDYDRCCVKCSVDFSDSNEEYNHTCKGKREKGFLCECKKLLSSFRGMETHKRFGCNRKPKTKNKSGGNSSSSEEDSEKKATSDENSSSSEEND